MQGFGRTVLALALLVPVVAVGADGPMGSVGAYGTRTDVDVGGGSADGFGFGVRGWASFGVPFVHGEYQQTTVEEGPFELDIESLRIGGGAAFQVTKPILGFGKLEYVDFGSDSDEDGVGLHAGAIWMFRDQLHFYGSLGFLSLNNSDGVELNAGATLQLNKQFGVFADLRRYMGSIDGAGGPNDDFEVTDVRAGGMLLWGH